MCNCWHPDFPTAKPCWEPLFLPQIPGADFMSLPPQWIPFWSQLPELVCTACKQRNLNSTREGIIHEGISTKKSCVTWWQFRGEKRLKDSTAPRLRYLDYLMPGACWYTNKRNQAHKDSFHSVHYSFWIQLLVRFIMNTSVGVGGVAHYHNFLLSLSVVTNLMMIIWFISIIFCFRGHICSRLVSVSWKLHLQAFSRHIEELSFMETSGFSTCKWGLAFLLPRGLIFCYWKYISTVWEKFYVGRLGRMSNASEKSFWEMRVCR